MEPPENCKFINAETRTAYSVAYRLWRYDALIAALCELREAYYAGDAALPGRLVVTLDELVGPKS